MTAPSHSFKKNIRKYLARLELIDPFRKPFHEIEFETTSYCNKKCAYCPNSRYQRSGSENGRYMKEEVFEKLLSNLSDMSFSGLIAPHLYGEPLTDPRLADWMSKIRKTLPHCTIKVVTNGDFLNRKKYYGLIDAGVNYFFISKHGPHLSGGVNELLAALSEEERSRRIRILDFYEDNRNGQKMLNSRGGDVTLTKKLQRPPYCAYVAYPVINTFGDVILCCNDFHGRYVSGNISDRHLVEIWRDPENVRLRKRIYKGYYELPICRNCWK